MSDGKNGNIFSFSDHSALSNCYLFKIFFPIRKNSTPSWIPDTERPLVRKLGCIHQVPQFNFIHRRRDYEIGYIAQIGHIKEAVMRCSVSANQPCPVEAEYDVKFLKRHIM